MKNQIKLGIVGLGTVGTGTLRILTENADLIRRRVGMPVSVVKIAVRDVGRHREMAVAAGMLTNDASHILSNPEIDIVVELIGGIHPAKEIVLEAIARKKHVVTANKALLARHGAEIFAAAGRSDVMLGMEASVGGGIPVVKALREAFAANHILSIYGIINGTSNFILTKMTEQDRDFGDVLSEAQRLGYAEANPTMDVAGIDSAQKLSILVSIAFGAHLPFARVYTEGITAISPIDIEFGKEFGYKLKLLAIAKTSGKRIEARVHPTMVPDDYPIAKVSGVYNAIQIVGDACGDVMLYGRGAGAMPTGSAVVADIMDISRSLLSRPSRRLTFESDAKPLSMRSIKTIRSLYYLRFMALDKPGVLSQIAGILGKNNISIAKMIQKGRKEGGSVPLVIMTHTAVEADVQRSLVAIRELACITEAPVLIRVEGED